MLIKNPTVKLKTVKVTPSTHRNLCEYGKLMGCRTITEAVEIAVLAANHIESGMHGKKARDYARKSAAGGEDQK